MMHAKEWIFSSFFFETLSLRMLFSKLAKLFISKFAGRAYTDTKNVGSERMKKTAKTAAEKSALILVGSLFFSASLSFFLNPASIVTGGVSGVAILLAKFVPLGIGTLFLFLNIPILIAGFCKFGKNFMLGTLYATLLSSLFTELFDLAFAPLLPLTNDLFFSAVFGGLLCGVGLGFVFLADATTGGTDIGVRLLQLRFPKLRPGILFFIIDFSVVLASAFVFSTFDAALYSTVALVTTSLALECVLYTRKN